MYTKAEWKFRKIVFRDAILAMMNNATKFEALRYPGLAIQSEKDLGLRSQ